MPRRKEWYQIQEIDISKMITNAADPKNRRVALPKPVHFAGANNMVLYNSGNYKYVSGIYISKEIPLSPYTIHIYDIEGYSIRNAPLPPVRIGVLMGEKSRMQIAGKTAYYKQTSSMYDPGIYGYEGRGTPRDPYVETDETNGKTYTSWWEIESPEQEDSPRSMVNLIVQNCEFPMYIGVQCNQQYNDSNQASFIGLRSLKTAGKQFGYLGDRMMQHGKITGPAVNSQTIFDCQFQLYRKNTRSSEVYISSWLSDVNYEMFDWDLSYFQI